MNKYTCIYIGFGFEMMHMLTYLHKLIESSNSYTI